LSTSTLDDEFANEFPIPQLFPRNVRVIGLDTYPVAFHKLSKSGGRSGEALAEPIGVTARQEPRRPFPTCRPFPINPTCDHSEKLIAMLQMNKSLATNLISVLCVVIGYMIPTESPFAHPIRQIGLYAVSGAITNWIAIYMLFEKVPGLYGSGVIPSRFEEFKLGIQNLVMGQFFTRENVESFFKNSSSQNNIKINPDPIVQSVDYDSMFERLKTAVMESPFGGMIGMFGGVKALEPLRQPFRTSVENEVRNLAASPKLVEMIQQSASSGDAVDAIVEKVNGIVTKRLSELTPGLVKQIIQDMIREHLGWLVIWGGVFGALIGLVASFL
jgi:hypothetical protein